MVIKEQCMDDTSSLAFVGVLKPELREGETSHYIRLTFVWNNLKQI